MLRSDTIISKRNYLIARLIKISTSGLRRREIHRRAARRPYCPTELFVSSVTIYETAPILILLLIGMTISLILFGIEKLVFYVMHPKRVTAGPPVPRKRNRMLLTDKEPSFFKNHNVIHDTLPKASTLFQSAAITKRLPSVKDSIN